MLGVLQTSGATMLGESFAESLGSIYCEVAQFLCQSITLVDSTDLTRYIFVPTPPKVKQASRRYVSIGIGS